MTTLAFIFALASSPETPAQMPMVTVPAAARASDHFDATAATDAYLAQIPASATSRSDAYFEGGYWIILWDFLFGALVSLLFLQQRWSAGMRDRAARLTRHLTLQSILYWLQFSVVSTLIGFPLTVYESYVREHQYGLATQTFGPWALDQVKGFAVSTIIGTIVVAGLFAIVRKLPQSWSLWGAIASVLLSIVMIVFAPVYIVPIFNTAKPLENVRIKSAILRLAHANGIPVDEVYEIDASKQTTRMSANVSGFANTMRITLNDNLISRATPDEIEHVMGHEMGHYVLNHILKDILYMLVTIVTGFAWLRWSLTAVLKRYGERWGVRDVSDPAVLPLVLLALSVFFFALTPVMNSWTRLQEREADMFGLNAARQPDGAAQAAIHLGEYRKMSPGALEEIIFFDHPSGRHRIYDAMVWKSQNLTPPAAASTPASQP